MIIERKHGEKRERFVLRRPGHYRVSQDIGDDYTVVTDTYCWLRVVELWNAYRQEWTCYGVDWKNAQPAKLSRWQRLRVWWAGADAVKPPQPAAARVVE